MTKVGGSLGFTLRKADSSALGHYVRALVREPALSDGRIRPGDKIVAVDGAPLSPMSHEEAVQLLRQCGPTVKLRLYRDLAQTPVSALSPTEPDHPLRPPRTNLRYMNRFNNWIVRVTFIQNVCGNIIDSIIVEKTKILDEKNKSKITEIFSRETLFLRKLILQIRKLLTSNLQNIFWN